MSERIAEFDRYIASYKQQGIVLNANCEYLLIVQNRCIETWFLGNKKIYKRNPVTEPLISYVNYFNVSTADPELMGHFNEDFSFQDFHLQYLRAMVREKTRKTYKKDQPCEIVDNKYIDELKKRADSKLRHISSLEKVFTFFYGVKIRMSS